MKCHYLGRLNAPTQFVRLIRSCYKGEIIITHDDEFVAYKILEDGSWDGKFRQELEKYDTKPIKSEKNLWNSGWCKRISGPSIIWIKGDFSFDAIIRGNQIQDKARRS